MRSAPPALSDICTPEYTPVAFECHTSTNSPLMRSQFLHSTNCKCRVRSMPPTPLPHCQHLEHCWSKSNVTIPCMLPTQCVVVPGGQWPSQDCTRRNELDTHCHCMVDIFSQAVQIASTDMHTSKCTWRFPCAWDVPAPGPGVHGTILVSMWLSQRREYAIHMRCKCRRYDT